MTLRTVSTLEEAGRFGDATRLARQRLALVPTMGFLHEGHLSLMREARRHADVVAVSIFVNPTQFGPNEDLARYPRDAEGDLVKCASAGVDLVFLPEVAALYGPGHQTWVDVVEVSQGLCGERRPGHFRGVATVVTKLLTLFRPHVALFGEKDYQQLQVIKALARDLNLGAEVLGVPTLRDADGLAMSSRNSYLSSEERTRALSLSRGMEAARALQAQGELRAEPLVAVVRATLAQAQVREDYVALVDSESLRPLTVLSSGVPGRLLVAAFVGKTRLIDNMAIGG